MLDFNFIKIKEYKCLTKKINRLKVDFEKPIFTDISRKIEDSLNLQFLEIYVIMLTDSNRNVTIFLLKYYIFVNNL